MTGLALLLFHFVAAEVFLGLGENDMLAQNRVVFAETELVWGVHGVLLGVVSTNTRFLRNEADEFTLGITFCHNTVNYTSRGEKSQKFCDSL